MNAVPPVPPGILGLIASAITYGIRHIPTNRSDPASRIKAVMLATNLTDKEGNGPKLLSNKPTEGGRKLTYQMPAGVIPKDFKDRQDYFENYGSCLTSIHGTGTPIITIDTYTTALPTLIKYHYDYSPIHGLAPLACGKLGNGKDLIIDLTILPHLLIGGMTGFGKTSYLLGASVTLKKAGCDVRVIDHKRLNFAKKGLSDYLTISLEESTTITLLTNLIAEQERRLTLFSGLYEDYNEYRSAVVKDPNLNLNLDYIVLIIDELNEIEDKTCTEMINRLIRVGRAPGISLILTTQDPNSKVWPNFTATRNLCSGRVAFYVSDRYMSAAILGKDNTSACRIPLIKGRALIMQGNEETTVQTMYTSADQAIKELQTCEKRIKEDETLEPDTLRIEKAPVYSQFNSDDWTPDN